jgi:hypothetical protein
MRMSGESAKWLSARYLERVALLVAALACEGEDGPELALRPREIPASLDLQVRFRGRPVPHRDHQLPAEA